MELKLYKKIIDNLKNDYEDIDYFIENPTEEFKYMIENDEYLNFDFSFIEEKIGVKLRYYQRLAIFFSNYYLNNLFNNNQLAYWMATGSGKTLIMKADVINYLNYLKNIGKLTANSQVEIIITSSLSDLIEQLRGEFSEFLKKIEKEFNLHLKITIDTIQSLMNKNEYNQPLQPNQYRIILADEAHIGLSSNKSSFKEFRNKLVEKKEQSFLFEYSATFYEISNDLKKEYEEKIIFEYNYDKFFRDFYGKDFKFGVIKADSLDKEDINENIKQNLDDFNKKLIAFEECNKFEDKPLLVVVGNKVNTKSSSEKEKESVKTEISDVLMFVEYLINLDDINEYKRIFNTDSKTNLYLIYNKQDDELLLAFDENKPFGLINVGDSSGLIKKLKEKENVVYREKNFIKDEWTFKNIDKQTSPINILIGSRKFSAGWNSYRVSQICLINFGVGKGNTIIQIFGRGVRLKGIRNDGKRRTNYVDENSFKTEFKPYSSETGLNEEMYEKLKYLETLFIYSLKSTYLKNFIEAHTSIFKQKVIFQKKIERKEGIPSVVIKNFFDFSKISEIKINDGKVFYEYGNKNYSFEIDLKVKMGKRELKIYEYLWELIDRANIEKFLLNKKFVIDFELLKKLIKSKNIKIFYDEELSIKKFENLVYKIINLFEKYIEKRIEKSQKNYKLIEVKYPYEKYTIEVVLEKRANIDLYKKIMIEVIELIKEKLDGSCELPEIDTLKVLSKVTSKEQNIKIDELFKEIDISIHNPIALHPEKNFKEKDILKQISLLDYIKEQEKSIEKITISPDSLDSWEKTFLDDLEKYAKNNKIKDLKVLRNIPKKGSGIIGLDEDFYPDFIILYKRDNKTHIIFCDPKGIRDAKNYWKVCVVPYLVKNLVKKLSNELINKNIEFHSFVITHTSKKDIEWTPIKELEEDKCFKYFNLLFFDYGYKSGKTYLEKLFEKVENDNLKKELENINKIKDNKSLEDILKYYYFLKDKFYNSKNLETIKTFFKKFNKLKNEKKEVQALAKEYDLNCHKIMKKEELLKMFFLKYIDEISNDEYYKICEDFSSIKEILKDKKGLAFDIIQELISITGSGLIFKIGKAIYEDFKR